MKLTGRKPTLTPEQVSLIRQVKQIRVMLPTFKQMGKAFGVSESCINQTIRGRWTKHYEFGRKR